MPRTPPAARRHRFAAMAVVAATVGVAGCSSSASSSRTTAATKESFCALLLAFRDANSTLDADINSGSPDTAKAAVQRLAAQAQALALGAPAGIKADVTTTATFLGQLDALLATYGYDLTTLAADPDGEEKYTALSTDAVQASIGQLRAYGDTECSAVEATSTTVAPATTTIIITTTTIAG